MGNFCYNVKKVTKNLRVDYERMKVEDNSSVTEKFFNYIKEGTKIIEGTPNLILDCSVIAGSLSYLFIYLHGEFKASAWLLRLLLG